MEHKVPSDICPEKKEVLSRSDYQEILLARMAGGDLYANELRMRMRRFDMSLDMLREATGEKPLYKKKEG